MKAAPNGPHFDPRRLSIEDLNDPGKVEEALTHWDELEPALLTAIETHPQHGPRLAMLRRADRWLDPRGRGVGTAGDCPGAEELYDYGRGPGYGPIAAARRSEIERHLARCRACEDAVETLASPPPVPLDSRPGDALDAAAWEAHVPPAIGVSSGPATGPTSAFPLMSSKRAPPTDATREPATPATTPATFGATLPSASFEEQHGEGRGARPRLRALPRLVPLAVAASLILALGVWIAIVPSGSESIALPQAPLLRGSSGGPLYFPRDRVLHPSDEALAAFPALGGGIVFEIEPQTDATKYQVSLARHGGDAFATEEDSIAKLSGTSPTIQATVDLPTGQYTWSVRAVVRGLDQELGARDFEVVEDERTSQELAALAPRAEPGRSLSAVRLLDERGYLGEARAIARAMPSSLERDAYLGQVPGR